MCREKILELINSDYYVSYLHRCTYKLPTRSNESPIPERAAARRLADEQKAAKNNPGRWPEGFDFNSLNDEDLVLAFERIVRAATKQM